MSYAKARTVLNITRGRGQAPHQLSELNATDCRALALNRPEPHEWSPAVELLPCPIQIDDFSADSVLDWDPTGTPRQSPLSGYRAMHLFLLVSPDGIEPSTL